MTNRKIEALPADIKEDQELNLDSSWWHTSAPSRRQKTSPLGRHHSRSHNCLLPCTAWHHWPPVPALVVLLNPRGNPALPIQITLHRARGSDVASDRERTNLGPQPRGPARRRPHPAVSTLWKNIFQCLIHSLPIHLPHVVLTSMRF